MTAGRATQRARSDAAGEVKRGQAAVNKARAGNVRGAVQILTGEGVAEGTAETEAAMRALVLEQQPPGESPEELERELTAATADLARHGGPRPHARMVRRRLRCLRSGAAPGASGWRNSHIAMLSDSDDGLGWLLEWARTWADGAVLGEAARLWARGVLVPLKRPGGKLRPIALTEALLKLAESIVIDAVFPVLRRHFHMSQFSVREAAGAELVVGCLRQVARDRPTHAILATDLSNAYGTTSLVAALNATRHACPRMLGLLVSQW